MQTKVGRLYFIKQSYFQKYSDTFPNASQPFPNVYANKNKDDTAFTEMDGDRHLSYRPYLKVFEDIDYPELGVYIPLSSAKIPERTRKIANEADKHGKCTSKNLVEDNLHYQSITLNRYAIFVRDKDIYCDAHFKGVIKTLPLETVEAIRKNADFLFNCAEQGDELTFRTRPFEMRNEMVRDINLEQQQAAIPKKEERLADAISFSTIGTKYSVDRALSGEKETSKIETNEEKELKMKDGGRE